MENAHEPTRDDTRGTSYCPLSADRRCSLPGSVEHRCKKRSEKNKKRKKRNKNLKKRLKTLDKKRSSPIRNA